MPATNFKGDFPEKRKPLVLMQDFRPALYAYREFTRSSTGKEGVDEIYFYRRLEHERCDALKAVLATVREEIVKLAPVAAA